MPNLTLIKTKVQRITKEILSPKKQKCKQTILAVVKNFCFVSIKCIKSFFFNRGRLVYIFISPGR